MLDIGCGNGWFLKWFKEQSPQSECLGVEQNKDSILECRAKAVEAVPYIPLSAKTYELITLWGTLEHLKDPKSMINKCSGLLSDRGFLLVCVPNISCDEVKKKQENAYMFCPQHLWYFDMASLHEFMHRMGYRISFYYGFNNHYQHVAIFKKFKSIISSLATSDRALGQAERA